MQNVQKPLENKGKTQKSTQFHPTAAVGILQFHPTATVGIQACSYFIEELVFQAIASQFFGIV